MKKILFVYDHPKPEQLEGDGLWSALDLMEKDFEIERFNLQDKPIPLSNLADEIRFDEYDFVLGWGAFNSKVNEILHYWAKGKKGLCLSAFMEPDLRSKEYDVIFYETEVQKRFLEEKEVTTKLVHAFGVNTNIFKPLPFNILKVWDYISVGAFSNFHRYAKLLDKKGNNLAIGNIMRDNIQESFNLIANAALSGWMISDQVNHIQLARLYNLSEKAYLPAEFGQERAVLEARACGIEVEVEPDNPKLTELLTSPIYDHVYYAEQLKKGILECL